MWAGCAAIDFFTRHHVQGKWLVYHRLFQQDETAIWRNRGFWIPREKRRHAGTLSILSLFHTRLLDSDAYTVTVGQYLLIRHVVKLKLTRHTYRLTVAFFFTGVFAEDFAVDLARAFDEASTLLPL